MIIENKRILYRRKRCVLFVATVCVIQIILSHLIASLKLKKNAGMYDVEVIICVSLFITITRTSQQVTVIIYRYKKSQHLTRARNPKKRR